MLDAIILSDLHLGSPNCEAKRICRLLESVLSGELQTCRLILNGDVFDSFDFRRLTRKHWRVLSLLRKLSSHVEIIWLYGNHDNSAEVVSHMLGLVVMDEYILESGGRRILVLHGHTFDDFLDSHPLLTWVGDQIYLFLQWLDRSHGLARKAKHSSKTFLRCTRKIEKGSLDLAKKRGCQAVCCGHTHVASAITDQPIHYYNSGCWTERPCSYLSIANGAVRVHVVEVEVEESVISVRKADTYIPTRVALAVPEITRAT